MGLWDITLDKAKENFVNGLAYAKDHSLYWHSSGDFYPYPTQAWRLDPVPDPDLHNLNLSFSPELLYGEVKGDLEQLKSKNVSYPIWEPKSGSYFSAKTLGTGETGGILAETEKCRKAFVAGTIDTAGYNECKARVAAKYGV